MRNRMMVAVAAGLLGMASGVAAFSQQRPAPRSGTAVLAGQVLDETTNRPISGAVVTLSMATPAGRPGGPAGTVRRAGALSNADGRFVFRDVPAGTFTVTSSLIGFTAGAVGQARPAGPSTPIVVSEGARITDLALRMWRLSTVSGTVRDDLGEPLVGVSVWVLRRSMTSGQPELVFSGGTVDATDEQGRFRLTGLGPGAYAIAVRGTTQTNPDSVVRTILQARAAAVTGRPGIGVTREGRESGAIQIERSGIAINGWQASVSIGSPQPLPGPDGTLLLHPSTYYPGVTDAAAATLVPLEPGVDRHGLDFTVPLVKGVRVSGTVIGPSGPAANNALRLIPQPADSTALFSASPVAYGTADGQGRFVLLGVPPGNYVLDAYRAPLTATAARMFSAMTGETITPPESPPPAVHARHPLSVGNTHVDGVEITMSPRAMVSGRVSFEGSAPQPGSQKAQPVNVVLINVQTTARAESPVAADGTFEIKDVAPGRYHVVGEAADRNWHFTGARSPATDLVTTGLVISQERVTDVVVSFSDKPISISGSVTDQLSRPATDGSVVLIPADVRAWIAGGMAAQRARVVRIATDGSYTLSVDIPGEYLIVAAPPDVHPQTTVSPITVDADFAVAYAPLGTKVTIASGDTRTQPLTMRRAR